MLLISACGTTVDTFATGTPVMSYQSKVTNTNDITVWNNLIGEIGIKEKLSPPEFSRAYTLVHISIYDSLLALRNEEPKVTHNESFYRSIYVSSIAEAASGVMTYLFPNYIDRIIELKQTEVNQSQHHDNLLIEKGLSQGREAALSVIDYAKKDNSDLRWDQRIPRVGSCIWNGTNPVNPMAGFWKTHILKSGSEIQPVKPQSCNSPADLIDIKQTYEAWKHRTPEQIIAAHYWGDKPPPVIWNKILNEQIQKYNVSIFDAARASVYLNVGMYDGFVSCWYAKYSYWTARPFQRISNITTEIPTPNFPGYPSGHSVISTVASRVLGEIFPTERDYLHNQAIEAGLSRLWAGIHFKQDITNGIDEGNNIADKVVEDMHKSLHTFISIK
jgi:PAP2 superfamily